MMWLLRLLGIAPRKIYFKDTGKPDGLYKRSARYHGNKGRGGYDQYGVKRGSGIVEVTIKKSKK